LEQKGISLLSLELEEEKPLPEEELLEEGWTQVKAPTTKAVIVKQPGIGAEPGKEIQRATPV